MRTMHFRGRKDLRLVIARGIRAERSGVSIRCLAGRMRYHRIAVVCPKTVSRKAVDRNRIRRIFFEAVRLLLRDTQDPLDCAILVRPGFPYRAFTRNDADEIVGAIKIPNTRI